MFSLTTVLPVVEMTYVESIAALEIINVVLESAAPWLVQPEPSTESRFVKPAENSPVRVAGLIQVIGVSACGVPLDRLIHPRSRPPLVKGWRRAAHPQTLRPAPPG